MSSAKPLGAEPQSDRFVDDRAAADLLGLSRSYLRQLRVQGGGPVFCRLGAKAIRYRVGDLVDWAISKRTSSTSEFAD